MSKLANLLKGIPALKTTRGPIWSGPGGEGPQGGITFSLISRAIICGERFRVRVIEGLKADEGFNHRTFFGDAWHVCEEAHAKTQRGESSTLWSGPLAQYTRDVCAKHPLSQDQVDKWYQVIRRQFPLYIDYWSKHADMQKRTPLMQEQKFDVPYELPSHRVVRLRGKWDSVDMVAIGKESRIFLMENKTKGEIDENQLVRQLSWDLQVMLYLCALKEFAKQQREMEADVALALEKRPIAGVRYNIIRRPLSGGKGTIVQHKPSKSNPQGESKVDYYGRVVQYIKDDPSAYFMRWNVEVSSNDVQRFRHQCLDPLLENLVDAYEWWADCYENSSDVFDSERRSRKYPHHMPRHYRRPFGVWDPLTETGATDLDAYLATGSTAGLKYVDDLFPELK